MSATEPTKPSFQAFLDCFPPVELPFTLGEDTHLLFSRENDPIPAAIIAEYILPLEGEAETDEVTEYIACFALPTPPAYHAIVYWKAELLQYEYKLFTFDTRGFLIDERVIAGTTFDGAELTQTVASIREDLLLYLVSGQNQVEYSEYAAATSTANRLQITSAGKIVEL
jgi:hypothetical protein